LVLLRSLSDPSNCLVFSEHKANVTVATPSPSQCWVASGDEEGNVLIWSYPSLKLKTQYKVGKSVADIDWDESSTRIVCAGDGNSKAKVISSDSGNSLGELSMHSLPVISAAYRKQRPFRVVTGSEDLSVNFYDGPPFKYKESYRGHTRYPNVVRFSPDGEWLVSAGADSRIVLYDGKTGEVKRELDDTVEGGHKAAIYALAWAPDSKRFITAAGNKQCKVWEAETGSPLTTFTFSASLDDMQVGVAWSAGFLVSVSLSGAINYLDISSPSAPSRSLHGHQSSIQSLVLQQAAGAFYTSGLTGEITRWTREGEARWLTGAGHGGKVVSALTLSADGRLHSFGLDDRMRVSQADSGEVSADSVALGGLPVAAVTTGDGVSAVVLAQEKAVVASATALLHTLPLGFVPTAIALSPDEKQLAVGGKDKKLRLYAFTPASAPYLSLEHTVTSHDKPITSIAFSPSSPSQYIASVDREASVYVHSLPDLQLRNKSGWRFHQAGVQQVDWSPDASTLATGSLDHSIIVWRDVPAFDAGKRVRVSSAHSAAVDGVRWWSDKLLISYSSDRTIKWWEI
jgi:WD40 repeat protein